MIDIDPRIVGFAAALGIGLLIGAERERRKGVGPGRAAAGIRTFAAAALTGAVAKAAGGAPLVAAAVLGIALLAAAAHWRARGDDPGLTTEVALVLTAMLGALAMDETALAAGLGAALAGLLAARGALHRFVGRVLSEREIEDGLIFAAVTLIAWPLLPDRPVALGFGATVNPSTLGAATVLVIAAGGAGYAARRALGAARGLPLAGFLGGFVSSTATIAAMGAHARAHADEARAAVAGALLSTVATFAQAGLLLWAISPAALGGLAPALLAGGVASALYAAAHLRKLGSGSPPRPIDGRAFDLRAALGFAALLGTVAALASGLEAAIGRTGLLIAAGLSGLADAHAPIVAVATLAAQGLIPPQATVLPAMAGLAANAASKTIAAFVAGGAAYGARVGIGLALSQAAAILALAASGVVGLD